MTTVGNLSDFFCERRVLYSVLNSPGAASKDRTQRLINILGSPERPWVQWFVSPH